MTGRPLLHDKEEIGKRLIVWAEKETTHDCISVVSDPGAGASEIKWRLKQSLHTWFNVAIDKFRVIGNIAKDGSNTGNLATDLPAERPYQNQLFFQAYPYTFRQKEFFWISGYFR